MENTKISEPEVASGPVEPSSVSHCASIVTSSVTESTRASASSSACSSDEVLDGDRFWAWATVLSAFIVQFSGFGYSIAFGVFQDFYVRKFLTTSTSSQISWIGSTQSFIMLTIGILTGPLFDKGYCYHLVITGSILLVFSLFMLSLAQPEQYYQVFLTQALGNGIGGGLSYAPSLAVLAQHFPEPHARARVMGIAAAGTSIGGLVHPILLNKLFYGTDPQGPDEIKRVFARGVRASTGLTGGLLLIALLLMRTKYPSRDAVDSNEKSGEKESDETKPVKLVSMMQKFASDWPYVFFVIGMTLFEIVFFFPSFYLQLKAIKHGLDPTFAFYSLSILNGGSFLGRLIPGFFVHTFGVANMFVGSTAIVSVLAFCMLAVRTIPGVAAFAALHGFFSGMWLYECLVITFMSPMLALLADSPGEIGARMGMCFAITGFGSLIGTPIEGALLTSKYIWWRPIIFTSVISMFGFLSFVACRTILGKRKGSLWIV